jgi:hypothetical protein
MASSPSELVATDITPPTEVEDLEDNLNNCDLKSPTPQLPDNGSGADINSCGSSTVYYEQEAFETY